MSEDCNEWNMHLSSKATDTFNCVGPSPLCKVQISSDNLLCDSFVGIAQVADLNGVAVLKWVSGSIIVLPTLLQLELFLLIHKETVDSRAHERLTWSDLVFLAGHGEASSNLLVVDIVAQVHHHQLSLRSLLAHFHDSPVLPGVDHDGSVAGETRRQHHFGNTRQCRFKVDKLESLLK